MGNSICGLGATKAQAKPQNKNLMVLGVQGTYNPMKSVVITHSEAP